MLRFPLLLPVLALALLSLLHPPPAHAQCGSSGKLIYNPITSIFDCTGSGSAAPSGAAGGALDGTYPNPTLANLATATYVPYISGTTGVLTSEAAFAYVEGTNTLTAGTMNAATGFTLNAVALASTHLSDTANIARLDQGSTFSTVQTILRAGIGTSSTDGLLITNTTAAANNAQQYSPALRLRGFGWETTGGTSQSADWKFEVQPTQGTAMNPVLWGGYSINGGAYVQALRVGTSNSFLGAGAGGAITTGTDNIAIGVGAFDAATVGTFNTVLGNRAMTATTTSSATTLNTSIGYQSLENCNACASNVAVGSSAGNDVTSGDNNTFVGTESGAGAGVTTNSGSVFLGYRAGYRESGGSTLLIDNQDRGSEAAGRTDSLIYGIFSATPATQSLLISGNVRVGPQNSVGTTTFHVYDATATTGTTNVVVRAGAGQSGNLFQVFANDGTTNRLSVDNNGVVTSAGNIVSGSSLQATSGGNIRFLSRARFTSPADAVLTALNAAETEFTRFNFGGNTSSFSAIGREAVNGFTVRPADGSGSTWNDASTAGSGTVADRYLWGIAAPTLTATNSSVTYTRAASWYIGGAPTASTNVTIGTPYALFVDAGLSRFDGGITSASYATETNCADSAGDAACGSAAAGAFVVDAADTNTVVSTTAVTANSEIIVVQDSSLGTRLSVTCNTTPNLPLVTARSAGTSFTVTLAGGPVTDPACFTFLVVN